MCVLTGVFACTEAAAVCGEASEDKQDNAVSYEICYRPLHDSQPTSMLIYYILLGNTDSLLSGG